MKEKYFDGLINQRCALGGKKLTIKLIIFFGLINLRCALGVKKLSLR